MHLVKVYGTMRQVIIDPGEHGYYIAECPSLPGCLSQGLARDETLSDIRQASQLYFDVLVDKGQPIAEERFETILITV
jgi:predicted RNase H-like HicB family nuclease